MKNFLIVFLSALIFLMSCIYVLDYIESSGKNSNSTTAPVSTVTGVGETGYDTFTPVPVKTPSMSTVTPTPSPSETPSGMPPETTAPATYEPVLEAEGFVNIHVLDPTIIVELRYATTNNFTKSKVYDYSIAVLRKPTALKLAKVSQEVAKDGYRLKIWDAYRTPEASWKLWELVKNPKYVSNPDLLDKHCKGAAVDLTLVDSEGNELVMPTEFDTFNESASGKYAQGEAYENWQYLKKVMERNGFKSISAEWWHYNDSDVEKYNLVDLDVNKLFGGKNN